MFSEVMMNATLDIFGTEEKLNELSNMKAGEILERICDNLMDNDEGREWAQKSFPDDEPKVAALKTFILSELSLITVGLEELQEKYGFNLEQECEQRELLKG